MFDLLTLNNSRTRLSLTQGRMSKSLGDETISLAICLAFRGEAFAKLGD